MKKIIFSMEIFVDENGYDMTINATPRIPIGLSDTTYTITQLESVKRRLLDKFEEKGLIG